MVYGVSKRKRKYKKKQKTVHYNPVCTQKEMKKRSSKLKFAEVGCIFSPLLLIVILVEEVERLNDV